MHQRNIDFCRLCEMVYGSAWQVAFHRDTGISERSIRRWVAGEYEVREIVLQKVLEKFTRDFCEIVIETINNTLPRPRVYHIATFEKEADYRKVMSDMPISYETYLLAVDMINEKLRWHITVAKCVIVPAEYSAWLNGKQNTPLNRARYMAGL